MSTDDPNGSRPPNFFIDKKQGVRHLLHSAIRMIFDGEDAFTINMLGQAADKVLLDLLAHAKIDDPVQLEDRIVPEHKNEFFHLYRRAFNFLKHANKDANEKLPVYDLVTGNEVLLFFNVIRFGRLFSEFTAHMQAYLGCAALLHPTFIKWNDLGEKGQHVLNERKYLEHLSRGDAIKVIRENCYTSGAFLRERSDDLRFVYETNHRRLSGKPGPKTLRIPT
jgi:hypothetical protein